MAKIRVLIADDQELFTESLRSLLNNYADDIEVVGIAKSGKEAIELAEIKNPQIILMDVRMPEINGVEATERILKLFPNIKIMILSTFDEDDYVREALHLGASGYLLKDISPTELIAAIRALMEGAIQISPSVAAKLVEQIYDYNNMKNKGLEWYRKLTKREKEIFKLISKGYSNKQIAKEIYIGEQTVRNYVSTIYSKLGIRDRYQIIQLANSLKIMKE